MTTEQIIKAYYDKKNIQCQITERLIKSGYQQEEGGYIEYAREKEIEVDYTKALPTQWWHLIESYCNNTDSNEIFGKNIVCGELILWMAEVFECVDKRELSCTVDKIVDSGRPVNRHDKTKPSIKYNRKK